MANIFYYNGVYKLLYINFYVFSLLCLILLIIGGFFGYLIAKPKLTDEYDSIIPQEIQDLSLSEFRSIQLYQNEWQSVLETQRHFNDLIIRFRGFTLTSFTILTGAAITAEEFIISGHVHTLMLLPLGFWLAVALLDLGYYHQLLNGSVAYAVDKFDNHGWLKSRGFFGLTHKIRKHVNPLQSHCLIIIYYILPLSAVVILFSYFIRR